MAGRHETAYLLRKGHPQKPELPMPDVLTWYNTGNWLHPNQKPVPALKPVIEAFSRPGDLVLDPFCGSGSTLLAAKILGRDYLGVELNQAFCQTTQRRLRANG